MSCPLASPALRPLMAVVCVAVFLSTSPRAWGQSEAASPAVEARDVLATMRALRQLEEAGNR